MSMAMVSMTLGKTLLIVLMGNMTHGKTSPIVIMDNMILGKNMKMETASTILEKTL